jgi:hypothetical protein
MKIITPVTITDAMLVSSSLTEADYPVWNGATSYADNDRVIRTSTHSIYQRLTGGTSATAPESDPVNWKRVGPTNRWAMFDRATGSVSTSSSTIAVTIAPGLVRGLALLDVDGNTARVEVKDGATTVYDRTIDLNAGDGVVSWDSYFFGDIVLRRVVVLTDIPPYSTGQITVTVIGSAPVNVGTLVVGSVFDVGGTKPGVSLGIVDYSKKSTDEFGLTTVVQRAFAKKMTVPVVIKRAAVDEVGRRLSELRATPVVWIGADTYGQSVIYGFYKDWSIELAYSAISYGTITIEGLS